MDTNRKILLVAMTDGYQLEILIGQNHFFGQYLVILIGINGFKIPNINTNVGLDQPEL